MRIKTNLGTQADEYHVASCNSRTGVNNRAARQQNYSAEIAELVQSAPVKVESNVTIALPIGQEAAVMSVEKAITSRVSTRMFSAQPLSKDQLAKVLHLANGVRKDEQRPNTAGFRRNAPSAGGLGSVEIYCVILNVEGIEPGIYYFDSRQHDLSLVKQGNFATWLDGFAMFQTEFSEVAALLVLTSLVGRLRAKYAIRSYRLALMDIGHVSQNIYLTATALGLGACATAGFVDAEMNAALGLDGLDRCAMLTVGIGVPAQAPAR